MVLVMCRIKECILTCQSSSFILFNQLWHTRYEKFLLAEKVLTDMDVISHRKTANDGL